MAIQPISSAIFNNRTANSVNFEGKSKEGKKHSTIKSSAMAVPLATLIAMSPLNTSAAERNSVFDSEDAKIEMADVKQFGKIKFYKGYDRNTKNSFVHAIWDEEKGTNGKNDELCITFISSTHDGKYQKLVFSSRNEYDKIQQKAKERYKEPEPYKVIITGFRPVEMVIVGDDGVPATKLEFEQLESEEYGCYSSETALKLINDFVSGKLEGMENDGAIKRNPLLKVRAAVEPKGRLYPLLYPKNTSWLDEGRTTTEDFGECIFSKKVKTKFGEYKIMAYDSDDNKKDFESLVIQKKGEGMYKVANLNYINCNVWDKMHICELTLKRVELYTRNGKNKVRLIDNELYDILLELTKDKRFNNAYKKDTYTEHSRIRPDGIIGAKLL